MPKVYPTSFAEVLLQNASESTKAAAAALCNDFAPHATQVFKVLVANGGDYEVEKAFFGRPERSLVLQFSSDIHAGNAWIPKYRLIWKKKKCPTDNHLRDCIGLVTGDAADSFAPSVTGKALMAKRYQNATLYNLIQFMDYSLEEVATQSGIPRDTLEALCRGEGQLSSPRTTELADILQTSFDNVRKAETITRRNVALGFDNFASYSMDQ